MHIYVIAHAGTCKKILRSNHRTKGDETRKKHGEMDIDINSNSLFVLQ